MSEAYHHFHTCAITYDVTYSSLPGLAASEQTRLERVKVARERLSLERLTAELKEAAR